MTNRIMTSRFMDSKPTKTARFKWQRLTKAVLKISALSTIFIAPLVLSSGSSSDYTAAPPFVATNVGKPNVVIALDISGSMKAVAYRDVGAGNWQKGLHDDFNPSDDYFGYFESHRKYRYESSPNKRFFVEDSTGAWNGNYLNWLTMRRMDVVRKVLVGGKIKNRNGEVIDGKTWYILEGQHEPSDHTFRKAYSNSAAVSPIPNNTEVVISEGAFSTSTGGGANIVALSDKVEVGKISINRDRKDASGDWNTVTFTNTYTSIPAVVATGLSYNGAHQSLARIKDVTLTGFKVRIDEWDYLDGNHTTEDVTFVVAATGSHELDITDMSGTAKTVQINAGATTVANTYPASSSFNLIPMGTAFSTTPVVFANTTTVNDATPVTVRIHGISSASFQAAMQEERQFASSSHTPELVSWIAIEPFAGHSEYANAAIEVNKTSNVHTESWRDINFTSDLFSKAPTIAAGIQTTNGGDPAVLRYGNGGVSKYKFDAMIEEEDSTGAGDLTHPAAESVGFLAIETIDEYRIRVGLLQEPTGILQDNAASIRFGVAVYNFDHTLSPTSIYDNNQVHGGTFRPCYPDVTLPVASRTNFDICLDTHVKAPLNNIIDVIEDHPLIWGTTPIAETLYDIEGYFAQKDYNRGSNSHTQWYDNGTEGTSGARNSYEINDDWDPYYYPEFNTRLPCAKSFVLHFNDGAPYDDFDGSGHPTITNDGIGAFGQEQVLDDLALELRSNDCRTDSGMTGHQDIISYYVYAALGEGEQLNDDSRRMREAAANGGFVDSNGDNQPTPAHPADFNSYVSAGNCTKNEWDEDADCNPDTFYFANDAEQLIGQLNDAFESITSRSGSGGAASVIAASRSGEGAVFNAIFRPSMTYKGKEVTWVGDVHALLIDDAGNLRQDDGDKTLEDPSSDNYIDMCSFFDGEVKEVRVKVSASEAGRPTAAQAAACESSVFNTSLFDIEYLWSGASWLNSMTDNEAITQRVYTSPTAGRYILSGIDTDNDGLIVNSEVVPFTVASFTSSNAGLINGDINVAHNIINYTRGQDITGFRSRTLDGKTQRLGDVIYSTPTVVGRPAENLDLIYGSSSYREFFNHYRYRRQVVYAGGNDGFLHAFNSGWFDPDTKQFLNAKGGKPGSSINFELGAELWAYSPYNTLAHLEYLTRPSYGAVSSDHIYFVDLEPRIFDAKIFADDTDHPGGWGTVLVVGSRLGGGLKSVDMDLSSATNMRDLRSSITVIDVTNPDKPPKILLEFTHPNLGFTTAMPTPIVANADSEGDGDWYLLLGSGADTNANGFDYVQSTQNGRLFLLDLKKIVNGNTSVLATGFGTNGIMTLPDANSFVSDLSSVDFGLDNFTTDAVYFGTVSGSPGNWSGKLYRLLIQENTGTAQKALNQWSLASVYSPNRPVTAPISMTTDNLKNRWLHFGTGRFFTQDDNTSNEYNYYYGIKEPRDTAGSFKYSTATTLADITSTEIEAKTGNVKFPPSLSPAIASDSHIAALEKRVVQYQDPSEYIDGWVRQLNQGERNFGAATIFGGTLTFTTFDPVIDECSVDGDARLYVTNALTGTAGEKPIIQQSDSETYNQYVIDLGNSPATSPSIHIGDGYVSDNKANAIIQTSDGAIKTVEQSNKDKVRSGEASWRQIIH